MKVKVIINGESMEFEGTLSLSSCIDALNISEQGVAIAKNGHVVLQGTFDQIAVEDGDSLEILRPFAGG